MKKLVNLHMRYSGFDVTLTSQNDPDHIRKWIPGEGEYEKNLFCTYMFKGYIDEYRTEGDVFNNRFQAEMFLNTSIILDYPTYEVMPEDTAWLCFSSYKPYKGEYLRLKEKTVLPAGIGAFCVVGTFSGDGATAKALNYFKPREYDVELSGNAKIILIKYGEYLNVPLGNP
jgi:hypothetical protein